MPKPKTIVIIASSVALLVIIAVVIALKSFDPNAYRDVISQKVADATGRQLTIKGDMELAVSLHPAVVVNDVRFANAAWGTRTEMVTLKRLEARMELIPLIFGKVNVQYVVLIEPDILLETNDKGEGNWVLGTPVEGSADKPGDKSAPLPFVKDIRIENASLTHRDGIAGKTTSLRLDKMRGIAESLSSPLNLSLAGTLQDAAFKVKAQTGPIAQLTAPSKPFPVKLEATLGGIAVTAEGSVVNPMEGRGLDLKLTANVPSFEEVTRITGVTIPPVGSLALTASLSNPADAPVGENLTVALETTLGGISAKADGTIQKPMEAKGVRLNLGVQITSLAEIAKITGAELPQVGPMAVTAKLSDPNGTYTLEHLTALLGENNLEGDASVKLGGERPAVTANIYSFYINVDSIIPPAKAPKDEKKEKKERIFSTEPIELSALKMVDAEVDLAKGRIVRKPVDVTDLYAHLTLKNGRLTLKPLKAKFGGGAIAVNLDIDASTPDVALATNASFTRADVAGLLKTFEITDLVTSGKGDVIVNVSGKGKSVHGIMAGLNGDARVVLDKSRVENKYIEFVAADLLKMFAPGEPKTYTDVNCFVSRFDVKDGLAENTAFLFDTEEITVGGGGNIHLGNETIAMMLKPQPKDPSLLSLATPVNISGKLVEPDVGLDKASLAKGIVGAVVGTMINPVGILVPLVSKGAGNENRCLSALADARKPAGKGKKKEEKKSGGFFGTLKKAVGGK